MPFFYISGLESFKANIAGHGDSFQMVCLNVFLQITICRFPKQALHLYHVPIWPFFESRLYHGVTFFARLLLI